MAVYKVIQDIEAEDKLLGPLTLRQFIYAGAAVIFFYLTFLAFTKGAAFMAVIFLPCGLVSGFFGWPWGRDQPTEVWALAKIRYFIKPRKRIWNQSGIKEMVTITAPRKIARVYTNNLSQSEVQSRLEALATTVDSRGWAIKNVNVNMYQQGEIDDSDRLIPIGPSAPVADVEAMPPTDMLEEGGAVSRQFDTMMAASKQAHRNEILESLRGSTPPEASTGSNAAPATSSGSNQPKPDFWFLRQQPQSSSGQAGTSDVTFNTQVVTPHTADDQRSSGQSQKKSSDDDLDEEALIKKLHEQDQQQKKNPYGHYHTILPLAEQQRLAQQQAAQQQAAALEQQQQVTPGPDPAILQFVNNDDLDVATIARQAQKRKEELQDEVVISLH